MATDFQYDVFLSHSSKDKAVVRELAERLRACRAGAARRRRTDGLKVWPVPPKRWGAGGFDEWEIKAGDDIYLAIERGLEAARGQVLRLSPAALESEWVALEWSTVLFRSPPTQGRASGKRRCFSSADQRPASSG